MFFSTEMLSKRGPLAKVWLAAHVERKVSKAQTLQTSIPSTVTVILEPASTTVSTPPLALRLSGQLLLGIARIYSKQAKYLLEDCSEASDKIRAAFRSDILQAITDDQMIMADDHLLLLNNQLPNPVNREAINLRPNANRNLHEFELQFGDGFGYGFGDGWDDLEQPQQQPGETGSDGNHLELRNKSTVADVGEITLPDHQLMSNMALQPGLDWGQLGQDNLDEQLLGADEPFDLGLNIEGLDSELRPPAPRRGMGDNQSMLADELMGDETIELEIGRDAPGTADRRSARDSLAPDQFGADLSIDKSYDVSGAGDTSFVPGFESTELLGPNLHADQFDPELELGIGRVQGQQDIEMAPPIEEGQVPPRAGTPLMESSLDKLNVTPRTSRDLAPHLHSPAVRPAEDTQERQQQPPKKKKKLQLIDLVTELDPDNLPSSQPRALGEPQPMGLSKFLPKDRYQMEYYRLSLDPKRHDLLPTLREVDGKSWLMAAPVGLCEELQALFRFPASASEQTNAQMSENNKKRARPDTEEVLDEIQSEQGRRDQHGDDRMSQIELETMEFNLETGGLADESTVTYGDEFGFEINAEKGDNEPRTHEDEPKEPARGAQAPLPQPTSTPVTSVPFPRQRAEGESSVLDVFDDMTETQPSHGAESESDCSKTVGSASHWSKNTNKALTVLKNELESREPQVMKFTDLAQKASKKASASFFFELLVLGTRDCIKLSQDESYGEIQVESRTRLWEVIQQENF